jgi:hypothetical protein
LEGADRLEQLLDVVIEQRFVASEVLDCPGAGRFWPFVGPLITHVVVGR